MKLIKIIIVFTNIFFLSSCREDLYYYRVEEITIIPVKYDTICNETALFNIPVNKENSYIDGVILLFKIEYVSLNNEKNLIKPFHRGFYGLADTLDDIKISNMHGKDLWDSARVSKFKSASIEGYKFDISKHHYASEVSSIAFCADSTNYHKPIACFSTSTKSDFIRFMNNYQDDEAPNAFAEPDSFNNYYFIGFKDSISIDDLNVSFSFGKRVVNAKMYKNDSPF